MAWCWGFQNPNLLTFISSDPQPEPATVATVNLPVTVAPAASLLSGPLLPSPSLSLFVWWLLGKRIEGEPKRNSPHEFLRERERGFGLLFAFSFFALLSWSIIQSTKIASQISYLLF